MGERDISNRSGPGGVTTTAFSNAVRLSFKEWCLVGTFTVLVVLFAPSLWKKHEVFSPGPDYRIPYDLANDYWLFERHADQAAARFDAVVIGDSVVWGEYAAPDETLSHYLNDRLGEERFANLGLEGAHPLALWGLVEHYAGSVRDMNVVLQCNPLWLSSPRTDMQDAKAADMQHPRLVPQFLPRIPSYPLKREKLSERIGSAVEQRVPFSSWTAHLQQAYYGRTDIPAWTLDHPYANPVAPLTRGLPPLDMKRRHPVQSWEASKTATQSYPWVDMDTSLQWRAFREVVGVLRRRGNRVFVLVGPFNEHMLKPRSRERYQEVKAAIVSWLEREQVPHVAPPPLPSELYGDASHPLPAGYALLARQLLDDRRFGATISRK